MNTPQVVRGEAPTNGKHSANGNGAGPPFTRQFRILWCLEALWAEDPNLQFREVLAKLGEVGAFPNDETLTKKLAPYRDAPGLS